MAAQAYVRVYATPGQREEAAKGMAQIEGVATAPCGRRPEVIGSVEAADHKTLGEIVLQRIQRAPGVEATETRVPVET
jgi:hypothetical protein